MRGRPERVLNIERAASGTVRVGRHADRQNTMTPALDR